MDHLRATTDQPFDVVVAKWGSGEVKTFDSLVRHAREARGVAHPFPSPSNRQCTSDLKTGPIKSATLTKLCELNGLPVYAKGGCGSVVGSPWRIVVMCLGIRGKESTARSQEIPWRLNLPSSKEGRAWFRWYPIFDWTREEVFDEIFKHGQEPFWTYGMTDEHLAMIREKHPKATHGMSRLSCQFCIMADDHDLTVAAHLAPAAYARRCELEDQMQSTMMMSRKRLPIITGVIPQKSLLRKRKRNPEFLNPWSGLESNPMADFVMNPVDSVTVTPTVHRLRSRLLR